MKSLRLLGVVLLFAAVATLPLHASETGTFDRTLQVSGTVDLDVTSGSGNIKVHTGGSGSVYVHATIRARDSWFGLSAQEKIKKLQSNPPVEQQGNTIRVGRIEDRELQQNVSIDYDVTVPAQTKVSSQTGSGNQDIGGVQLAVNIRTGSGNITLDNIGAGVRAEAGSGNIHAHGIAGEVSVNTGSGDIEVEQSAAGSVRANAGSGNVKLRGVKGSLRAETGSGDITVDGDPTGDWRVSAGSGNIGLRMPSSASFDIDARTSSGRLTVNRQVTMQGTFSRNHVQGKVGSGGVLVDLHTGSGDIQVN